MVDIPNHRHSILINDLCRTFNLIDPYRLLWPNRKDFSYVTRNHHRKNRSQIDFFLISNTMENLIQKCNIDPCAPNSSFDHKAVTLSFKKQPRKGTRCPQISHSTLTDPITALIAKISTIETYVQHMDNNNIFNLAETTGRARRLLRKAGPPPQLLPDEELLQGTVDNYNTRTQM